MPPKYPRAFAMAAVVACAATLFTSTAAFAHLEPVPGQTVRGKSATITFKVPNEFAEFAVTLGTMPDNTDKLVINAVQTYESGEVVNWNQPPPTEGQAEPEHPAPVLKLVANDAEASSDPAGEHGTPAAAAAPRSSATWLGGSALGVAALALGIAIGTALRSRRTSQTGDSK